MPPTVRIEEGHSNEKILRELLDPVSDNSAGGNESGCFRERLKNCLNTARSIKNCDGNDHSQELFSVVC